MGFIKVGIFGCGWLGRALAKKLANRYTVFGAVRSEASMQKLQKQKIRAFQNPAETTPFWQSDILVIAISPRENYLTNLKKIAAYAQNLQQCVLLSSISVYSTTEEEVDEESAINQSAVLAKGEALFRELFPLGTIVRLGGLMGENRIAGQWKSTSLQDSCVNYVHQDDAVGIVEAIIDQGVKEEIINAVAPEHPKRSEVYQQNCQQFGYAMPMFEAGSDKVVLSKKSEFVLNYTYQHRDPKHFWLDN